LKGRRRARAVRATSPTSQQAAGEANKYRLQSSSIPIIITTTAITIIIIIEYLHDFFLL
jgi:hypothetical protein